MQADERLDLIDAVIYADLFDCAVTAEEAWRYSRVPVDRAGFRDRLRGDPALAAVITERDGLCCLAGREVLLDARPERRRRALRLRARARRAARLLQHLPFVRGLLLTGSAGADDAEPGADVDMLVLVSPGRLCIAFTVLGGLSRLLSRAVFCPNHYISQSHPTERRRDLYVAHELLQAYPLAGQADSLREANGWAAEILPNAGNRTARVNPLPGGRALQRLLEGGLRGRLGDALERALLPLARARLAEHHAVSDSAVPDEVAADLEAGIQLRFHASLQAQTVMERHRLRREQVAAALDAASDGERGPEAPLPLPAPIRSGS